jgi:hypothetical protein
MGIDFKALGILTKVKTFMVSSLFVPNLLLADFISGRFFTHNLNVE